MPEQSVEIGSWGGLSRIEEDRVGDDHAPATRSTSSRKLGVPTTSVALLVPRSTVTAPVSAVLHPGVPREAGPILNGGVEPISLPLSLIGHTRGWAAGHLNTQGSVQKRLARKVSTWTELSS